MMSKPKLISKKALSRALFFILCGLLIHLAALNVLRPSLAQNAPGTGTDEGYTSGSQSGGEAPTLKISGVYELRWLTLHDGLELFEAVISKTVLPSYSELDIRQVAGAAQSDLIILRVNPNLFEFTLHMASEDGIHRSLQEHAKANSLYAAINAGMYLPDNLTSTGFMQSATHTNNPRIASRYGAFFLAEPDETDMPNAALREKSELGQDISASIKHYRIVVQNFRLFNIGGKILWPESSTAHSISALAEDMQGNILLVLCRFPLSPADFSRLLMKLPLQCRLAMYLEGGSPAGLLVKIPEDGALPYEKTWRGKRNSFIAMDGPEDSPLPNVIGLRPRQKEK